MAANKTINIEPIALTATLTTNILNCAIASLSGPVGYTQTQPYLIIRHVRISNKTAGAVTFSLWKGATGANAAGTEFIGTGVSVPANAGVDYYGIWRFDSGDFLVGGASAATALTITMDGEIGVAG
jgi:hypothetical protein